MFGQDSQTELLVDLLHAQGGAVTGTASIDQGLVLLCVLGDAPTGQMVPGVDCGDQLALRVLLCVEISRPLAHGITDGPPETRTRNSLLKRQVLYRLS